MRVRPPNAWEAARLPEPCYDVGMRTDGALSTPGHSTLPTSCLREVVKVIDDRVLVFDPEEKDKARAFVERGFLPPGTKRYKDKRFMFDRVFNSDSRQTDVYEGTAMPLLDGLLDGYNATVFAYGVRRPFVHMRLSPSYSILLFRLLDVVKLTPSAVPTPILESFT